MPAKAMQVHEAILSRRSIAQLALPVPDDQVLTRVFDAAGSAPDHRLLRPWRYLTIQGDALPALGELFYQAMAEANPERAAQEQNKLRQMPLRAPMIIVAILKRQDQTKVPDWEQWLSLGASVQNLLLTLHAEGFAAMWRTGDLTALSAVKQGLGLTESEEIGGFIYVGTAAGSKVAPARPESLFASWTGARA